MSRNLIIGLVVGGVVLVGGGAYFVTQNGSDSSNDSASQQSSENASQDSSTQAFDAVSTNDTSFVATISTSDTEGKTSQSTMEYDKSSGNVRYTSTADDKTFTITYTSDAYYMCQSADRCIKYPLNGVGDSGFDRSAFEYTAEELAGYKNSSAYQGKKDCPSGTCDVWQVSEGDYRATIYIDAGSKKIVQVEGTTGGTTSKIVYEYKDVSITPPANAQEIPAIGQ